MPQPLETPFLLRDARSALIRPACSDDYPSLMEAIRAVAAEDRGVVRTLAEMPQTEDDEQKEFAKWRHDASRTGARGCWFVAVLPEGRVIGEADVRRMAPLRLRHVAHLGLSVHPQFQRLGVGRALMLATIDWCTSGPGVELGGISRVDLNVLADNDRAIAMYKSLGFEIEGRRRRFIRREDGSEVDDLVMAKLLDH